MNGQSSPPARLSLQRLLIRRQPAGGSNVDISLFLSAARRLTAEVASRFNQKGSGHTHVWMDARPPPLAASVRGARASLDFVFVGPVPTETALVSL